MKRSFLSASSAISCSQRAAKKLKIKFLTGLGIEPREAHEILEAPCQNARCSLVIPQGHVACVAELVRTCARMGPHRPNSPRTRRAPAAAAAVSAARLRTRLARPCCVVMYAYHQLPAQPLRAPAPAPRAPPQPRPAPRVQMAADVSHATDVTVGVVRYKYSRQVGLRFPWHPMH